MKKTLTLRPVGERAEAPKIQKKGRGWAISGSRLDAIHDRARQLRREPDEAHLAPRGWNGTCLRSRSRLSCCSK